MKSLLRHRGSLHLALLIAIAGLLMAGGGTSAQQAAADQKYTAYLPVVLNSGPAATPAPPDETPLPGGSLPGELVGTWFSGQLLNREFYEPATGIWHDAGGLGHTYVFSADGTYILASALEIRTGPLCVSNVWKYHAGTARVEGANLLLTPSIARTRTVINCGSHSESDVEGDHATAVIPWQLGEDANGHTQLQLAEEHGVTTYFKDGLAPQMLGAWRRGGISSTGFYNPATGQWAEPVAEGEWYRFNANGTYSRGEVVAQYTGDPCPLAVMTYEEGALSGSGSNITIAPASARRHTVNLCDTDLVTDETLAPASAERWVWSLAQGDEGETLELMRISSFRQLFFVREE